MTEHANVAPEQVRPPLLVLDTNVLLHFQRPDSVEWCKLVSRDSVQLVLSDVALRELDRQKSEHPNITIRHRARVIATWLEGVLAEEDAQLRPGVELRYRRENPTVDFTAHDLQEGLSDDELIAFCLSLQEAQPLVGVFLITDDSGMRIIARDRGIQVLALPDKYRRGTDRDPRDEKIAKLKRQLDAQRAASPDLGLQFPDESNQAVHRYDPDLLTERPNLDADLERLREKYPPRDPNSTTQQPNPVFSSQMSSIPPKEFERYNREREAYFQLYREYLIRSWLLKNLPHRSVLFDLVVTNSGKAPAEEIDVHAHFPDGVRPNRATEDLYEQEFEEPTPPVQPRTELQMVLHPPSLHVDPASLLRPPAFPSRGQPRDSVRIRRVDSYEVRWPTIHQLKHRYSRSLDPLLVLFERDVEPFSFSVEYELTAANLPEPVEGELHVIIES